MNPYFLVEKVVNGKPVGEFITSLCAANGERTYINDTAEASHFSEVAAKAVAERTGGLVTGPHRDQP